LADESPTRLEAVTAVPSASDTCLDHSVRELGMSAKRPDAARLWIIQPQFLHPAVVPHGTVQLRFEREADRSSVRVTATWPGGRKAEEEQREIESRVIAIATKLAQICGVIRPEVTCKVDDVPCR